MTLILYLKSIRLIVVKPTKNHLQIIIAFIYFVFQSTLMEKEKYLQDLKEIRVMMERSSKFISLSGLSGVSAGIIALAGALFAYKFLYTDQNYLGYRMVSLTTQTIVQLILLGLVLLILAVGSAIFFTNLKAKKRNLRLWDNKTKAMVVSFLVPLGTGGVLCLIFLLRGYIGIVAPLTLIFYGLGLVSASTYTYKELRSLGVLEIVLGLVATVFVGYGILFWAIGFGVLHILYGLYMHFKYGS